jgi:hypothetical protein
MTMYEASKNFHKFFPERKLNAFLDPLLSYLSGTPKLDVCKFDDFLHEKHGSYEKQKMSMKDVLEKHYGKEAKDFIKKLL